MAAAALLVTVLVLPTQPLKGKTDADASALTSSLSAALNQSTQGASTNIAPSARESKFLNTENVLQKARAARLRMQAAQLSPSTLRDRVAQQIRSGLKEVAARKHSDPPAGLQRTRIGMGTDALNPQQQRALNELRRVAGDVEVGIDRTEGTLRYLRGDLIKLVQDLPGYAGVRAAEDPVMMSKLTLGALAGVLNMPSPDEQFVVRNVSRDELGMEHVKFDQQWQGVPVYGGQVVVHLNDRREPVQVNGVYAPGPATGPLGGTEITAEEARAIALRRTGTEKPGLPQPEVKKVVYWYPGQASPIVSYQVPVIRSLVEAWHVFVSATDGSVLQVIPAVYSGAEVGSSRDLLGATQTVHCWKDGVTYYACDTSLSMYDTGRSQPVTLRNIFGGICVLDVGQKNIQEALENGTVVWSVATNPNNWDPTTVSMLSGLAATYNYYMEKHGQKSMDGNGCSLISYVHARFPGGNGQLTSDNAFYNSALNCFIFGDGDAEFKDLPSALDVIAHELTHGVSHHLVGLVYQNQSGALSEHLSDFIGCMVDRDEWLAGDGIIRDPSLIALRDLSDPHNPQVQSKLPKTMAEYQNLPATAEGDNGGVHINCGIPSYASYLMTDGPQGIGRDKAERIVFRAMKQGYLTSNAQFADYRRALVQSAVDLFGDGAEAAAVRQSFDAVGITDGAATPPPSQGTPGTGTEMALFMETDFDFWGFPIGDVLYVLMPNDYARVAANYVSETRPAISGDGGWALYVSVDNDLYWTDGATEEQLTTDGLVRTIAMTKDQKLIAFTTTDYANTIEVLDLVTDQSRTAVLEVPTDAEGVVSQLSFADVLTFNFAGDTLVFDAFAEGGAGTSRIGCWGTYALRIKDLAITPVFPASVSLQVGNPSLANTLAHQFVADYIKTEPGQTNIGAVSVDLLRAQVGQLGSGLSVLAEPSFRADDSKVIYRVLNEDVYYLNEAALSPDRLALVSGTVKNLLWSYYPLSYPVGFREGSYQPASGKCEVLGAGTPAKRIVDFGSVQLGSAATRTIVITNAGNADLALIGLHLEGADTSAFAQDGINQVIPAGRGMPVSLVLRPQREGAQMAALRLRSTVPREPDLVIDLTGVGLPSSTADSDGDGMTDSDELVVGTDPASAQSVFKLLSVTKPPAGTQGVLVEWVSAVGRNYTLSRSTNLKEIPAFSVLRSNIAGQAGTTRFVDSNATGTGPYFYRVGARRQ